MILIYMQGVEKNEQVHNLYTMILLYSHNKYNLHLLPRDFSLQ